MGRFLIGANAAGLSAAVDKAFDRVPTVNSSIAYKIAAIALYGRLTKGKRPTSDACYCLIICGK